jgi:hypothetical protein
MFDVEEEAEEEAEEENNISSLSIRTKEKIINKN